MKTGDTKPPVYGNHSYDSGVANRRIAFVDCSPRVVRKTGSLSLAMAQRTHLLSGHDWEGMNEHEYSDTQLGF